MNGIHDLGGMDGFGVVDIAQVDTFREPWELRARALLLTLLAKGVCTPPEARYAVERMRPELYLMTPYSERTFAALVEMLVNKGVLTRLPAGTAAAQTVFVPMPEPGSISLVDVPTTMCPRFEAGNPVRVANRHPHGHTRCPRYVRGRRGAITRHRGSFIFDDIAAHSPRKVLQPVYTVRFESSELWGQDSERRGAVYVDLFDAYLEEA